MINRIFSNRLRLIDSIFRIFLIYFKFLYKINIDTNLYYNQIIILFSISIL